MSSGGWTGPVDPSPHGSASAAGGGNNVGTGDNVGTGWLLRTSEMGLGKATFSVEEWATCGGICDPGK